MNTIPKGLEGATIPVIAAPMFLVSGPELVIECCKNGVVGTFPALNERTSEGFEQWLITIKEALSEYEKTTGKKAAPFGVNLIVHPTNTRLQKDVEICVKHKVPLVITSLGAISILVNAIHSYGGLVYHDIVKKRHAEKAAEAGVDGLILVSAGAGGHAGTINPMALIKDVRKVFEKTIVVAGAISTGMDIASVLQMGADMAYMGTRFINTTESRAQEEYKEMIVNSTSDKIIHTAAVSGIPANFMEASLEAAGIKPEDYKKEGKLDPGLDMNSEAKAWKTIWSAGHGVSAIDDVPSTEQLIDRLRAELVEAMETQQQRLDWLKSLA
ncbi:MAG: NAD(P)H-dependent flavin oxidoreductase [Flavobacteriaceae bacterium]|jgi:nitronate monooxygenase